MRSYLFLRLSRSCSESALRPPASGSSRGLRTPSSSCCPCWGGVTWSAPAWTWCLLSSVNWPQPSIPSSTDCCELTWHDTTLMMINDSSGCQSSYCAPSVCLEDDHHGALWWGTWGVWEGRELLVTHSLNLDLRIWITIGINILVDLRYNVCPAYKRRWNV